jgi:aspartyl-tRNA(Asn)/glutamyl-tRNA(Gln) amidotransferase subunit C
MAITRDDVRHVALLARLQLTEDEEVSLTAQLDQILAYFHVIDELDTRSVEPTAHVTPMATPFREDSVTTAPDAERWLENAPSASGKHFRVPKIIE